ncbi:hypothetical protein H5P28_15575 [Ruficoccus amylovorans]|uniref:Transposase n=1 Tax=Ruficoccus amylovorans TaxID=1804625 RepID=A0A842HI64_9BACT|nr:hypothetical protein [Ruficoccus amylovorans]MBC2592653.1 hypothetical protein [Ruficoccus amylovorans]MBC2592710.1 hypothetical protein [Ruficoccus amylovorans]MBC2592732.1 hypothetical protein [Ruficoccus amylovorans]MBC2592739.1 hypothetical protein [Ruficoccus amylovorans]MBC2592746.1 hypothetical protein [Ruficoccus amylovorans]
MDLELVDTGAKRDSRGRRIESREERERLLESYDGSGLTQKAFARREGVAYNTLVYWLKQRRERSQAGGGVESKPLFHEMTVPSCGASLLEVCLPEGLILRGGDAQSLAALVKALRC